MSKALHKKSVRPEVGMTFFGHCNGYFGDVYDDLRVEAVGFDWIVARSETTDVYLATFVDQEDRDAWTARWRRG